MKTQHNQLCYLVFMLLSVSFLASCATVPSDPFPYPRSKPPREYREKVIHTVAPGETLWRISKIYDVPASKIRHANKMGRRTDLFMGEKLIIPDARKAEQPIPLYPSKKWRYIIVHHTATEKGSSLNIHKSHLNKGWDRGIGYHFIINNGEEEKPDGFIEVTPRWLKQQDGAHCKASDMNTKAIGISLIGDFTHHSISNPQMKSLVELTNKLRKYYRIPIRNILRHGEVHGSSTECPGKSFPWERFKKKLLY